MPQSDVVVHFTQHHRKCVGNRHGTVLAARTAHADGQVGLGLGGIPRDQEFEQALDPVQKLPGIGVVENDACVECASFGVERTGYVVDVPRKYAIGIRYGRDARIVAGVNVRSVYLGVFAFEGAAVALAAAMVGPRTPILTSMGFDEVIMTFVVVVLGVVGYNERGRFADDLQLPGAESQAARDLLEERFPQQAGDPATLVINAPSGFDDPLVRARVEQLLVELGLSPQLAVVEATH